MLGPSFLAYVQVIYCRLNMEIDLQSLVGLHVYSLAETPQLPPPLAFGLIYPGRYWSAKIDDISL
jgi:hypothetical protein